MIFLYVPRFVPFFSKIFIRSYKPKRSFNGSHRICLLVWMQGASDALGSPGGRAHLWQHACPAGLCAVVWKNLLLAQDRI